MRTNARARPPTRPPRSPAAAANRDRAAPRPNYTDRRTQMSTAEPKVAQSETVRKHKEFVFPAVANYYQEPIALVRGEDFHVWDDQGNRYLDCFGGVLTVSVGHANPQVNAALIEQVNTRSEEHTSQLQ